MISDYKRIAKVLYPGKKSPVTESIFTVFYINNFAEIRKTFRTKFQN